MKTKEIEKQVERDFSEIYHHFKDFQQCDEYRKYWEVCIGSITDGDLLSNIIFCNDVFGIPPVKTFLIFYRDKFKEITGDERARLDAYVKRSIGAFWGMVFKYTLNYTEQKSVSVSMNDCFLIKTATVYSKKEL